SNETLVIDEDCDESSDAVSEIYEYDLDLGLEDIDESGFFMPDSSDIRFENGVLEEDPYDFVYDGLPSQCHVLKDPRFCVKCGAKKFEFEYPTLCCMGGKTKLVDPDIPPDLYNMFISQCDVGKRFRRSIRAYNTNFSFALMGVQLDESVSNMTSGVYTFRAHDGIYHKIDQLVLRDGKPRYLQLYFYDDDEELQHRLSWNNIDEDIVRRLISVLAENSYVQTFQSLRELGPLNNYRVGLKKDLRLDQRLYNRPTTSEVAGIWVEGIFMENEDDNVSDNNSEEDEDSNERKKHKTISMREYYCYKMQIKSKVNLLLLGGRLLQQFLVDMYIKMETSRLSYLGFNQSHIRADLYQGLVDCVTSGKVQPNRIGQRVVLPGSFIGGPRDMRRRFLDAMTLVQDDGKPDLFLTMTCNPKWPEIENELLDGQTGSDRPDLVARVFRAKLKKRGLPHVHFLIIMEPQCKFTNPDHYNKVVCAKLPDPKKHPLLYKLVVKYMMHGPCGQLRYDSPCMQGEQKKCQFNYPKEFIETTAQTKNSYPLYRRRDNGSTVNVRNSTLDNRWVVLYNPKLLSLFNCHMNVEVCSSIVAVKYAFKYQDARYISPPKEMWRIYGFPLANMNPVVVPLQVHLPDQQQVRFADDANLTRIIERERDKRSIIRLLEYGLHGKKPTRGRLVSAHPAEGERFYLRILLQHFPGPPGFDFLYTVNGVLYSTFRKVALVRGLIENDESLSLCLSEATLFSFPPALRRLFATILTFCAPGDVRKLWDDHYETLFEDSRYRVRNAVQVRNKVLHDIRVFLRSLGKDLSDFDIPELNTEVDSDSFNVREVEDKYAIFVDESHLRLAIGLMSGQKLRGTGKTYMYNALLARSCGSVALATASSGDAANNLPGGRTTHSRFKIPLNVDKKSFCSIKKQSGTAKLIREAKLIIWDEASMAKRHAIEVVDRTMPDIMGDSRAFGGEVMVMGGDFWQVLPVVRRVGDGVEESIEDTYIKIPNKIVIPYIGDCTANESASTDALIDALFPVTPPNTGFNGILNIRGHYFIDQ
ncbi:uncharacterized protein Tco_0593671, partial [Tanacetum coccineum]